MTGRRPRASAALVVLAGMAGAAGCGGGGTRLLVDVKTDLAPGIEVDRVRVRVTAPAGGPSAELAAVPGDDWLAGRRVADFAGLRGEHALAVEALLEGTVVLSRPVSLDVVGERGLTVILSRDCRGVTCPADDGDPTATACLGGACVDDTCTEESGSCADECADASGCPPGPPCTVPVCDEGVCLLRAETSACDSGQACSPEVGCRSSGPRPVSAARLTGAQLVAAAELQGDIVVVGEVDRGAGDLEDVLVARLRPPDDVRWAFAYDRGGEERAHAVEVTRSGEIVVAASAVQGGVTDGWLLRLEGDGATRWSRVVGGVGMDDIRDLTATSDGGFAFAGVTASFTATPDVLVGRVTREGELSWLRAFGSEDGAEAASAVVEVATGDLVVGARTDGFDAPLPRLLALGLGGDGAAAWARTYGGDAQEVPRRLSLDGARRTVYFVGSTGRGVTGTGSRDAFVIAMEASGEPIWQLVFGGPSNDDAYDARWLDDGRVLVAGASGGSGALATIAAPTGSLLEARAISFTAVGVSIAGGADGLSLLASLLDASTIATAADPDALGACGDFPEVGVGDAGTGDTAATVTDLLTSTRLDAPLREAPTRRADVTLSTELRCAP